VRILVTGSSGRIGRAIFGAAASTHTLVGLDRSPFSTSQFVGDVADPALLRRAMVGIDAIIHCAALHAPHVGVVDDAEFIRVNVDGLRLMLDAAFEAGVRTIVYTSTTALYGDAVLPEACTWIDASTVPVPKTIYHRTKLAAEALLEQAAGADLAVRIVRMSRCFPEPVDRMALYRLHRGIDVRDVADAHLAALVAAGAPFQRHIASGSTPFRPGDVDALSRDARDVLQRRCPALVKAFERRNWSLPDRIDRVYDASATRLAWGWQPRFGFAEVLAQHDRRSLEVLPCAPWLIDRTPE
jgi:UDP-glucose 4-epimerase